MKRVCVGVVVLLIVSGLAPGSAAANRDAERAFREGRKLARAGKVVEAFEAYRRAAELEPKDIRFIMAREVARQHAAFRFANAGVLLLEQRRYTEAIRELEQAEKIDPSNDFVKQELSRARQAVAPPPPEETPILSEPVLVPEPPLKLYPKPGRRSWDLRGDAGALYLALEAEYGIRFTFDESMPAARTVRFRVDNADFAEAIRALTAITGTMVAPLETQRAVVAANSVEKHAQFDRITLAELSVEDLTPEEINEVVLVIRNVLDLRFIQQNTRRKIITVRDTALKVTAAEQVVAALAAARPQVLIEMQTLEVFKTWSSDLGLNVAYQTSAFKLSPVTGKVQTGTPVPLPQLFGQAQPLAGTAPAQALATFGGGQSLFGITLPGATLQATLGKSIRRGISTLTVRAADNLPATFLVGSRYPIMNASFSPILFSAAIQEQQQAGTLINPFPSFTFEDLGIKVKITPLRVHDDQEVTLKVEAQTRALTGQTFNGVPSISNRQTEQTIRVLDGQPTVMSGVVQTSERTSLLGAPYLAQLPVLRYLFGLKSGSRDDTEILIVLTPHILKPPPYTREAIYLPTNYVPVARVGEPKQ